MQGLQKITNMIVVTYLYLPHPAPEAVAVSLPLLTDLQRLLKKFPLGKWLAGPAVSVPFCYSY